MPDNTIRWKHEGVEASLGVVKRHSASFMELRANILGTVSTSELLDKSFVKSGERVDFLRRSYSGIRGDVSKLRNDLLLLAFTLGGVGKTLWDTVDAANKYQMALTGITTVAVSTGNKVDLVGSAVQSLTKDGLLSIADASRGLKNLLSTGFGLDKSIALMRVFKDAAAFNRQGTLEFGEAIVGATEGIKNQNSRMVDNVGITKNLSIIMKESGYVIQDLADETKKVGAMQALYNGLVKEGSIFTGDAMKSAALYTGVQAQLGTQLFRTKAAFGEILIGTRGVFNETTKQLIDFIKYIERWIEINKSLISSNVNKYFEQFSEILNKIWIILGPVVTSLLKIVDVVADLGIAPWLAFFYVLEKIGMKFVNIQKSIRDFAGPAFTTQGMFDTRALTAYGKNVDKVNDIIINTKKQLTSISSGINLPANWTEKVQQAMVSIDKGYRKFTDTQIGKMPLNVQKFWTDVARSPHVLKATENIKEFKMTAENMTAINFDVSAKKLQNLAAQLELAGVHGVSFLNPAIATLNKTGEEIKKLETGSASWGRVFTSAFTTAGNAIKAFTASMWAAAKSMAPLLALQAVIMGIVWAWDKLGEADRKEAEMKEKLLQSLKEDNDARQRVFNNRVAGINKMNSELEAYKALSEKVNKTSQDYKLMNDKKLELQKLATQEKIDLKLTTKGQLDYAASLEAVAKRQYEVVEANRQRSRSDLLLLKETEARTIGEKMAEQPLLRASKYPQAQAIVDAMKQYGLSDDLSKIFDIKQMIFDINGTNVAKTTVQAILGNPQQVGEELQKYADMITQRIEDTRNALAKEREAGGYNRMYIDKLEAGIEANHRMLQTLQELGIVSKHWDEQLAETAPTINQVTTATNQSAGALANWAAWLSRINELIDKAKAGSTLGNRIISAIYEPEQQKIALDKMMNRKKGGLTPEQYSTGLEKVQLLADEGINSVLRDTITNFENMNEQLDLNLQKFGLSDKQIKVLDLDLKNLTERNKLDKLRDDLNRVIETLNPTQYKLIGNSIESVADKIQPLIDKWEQYTEQQKDVIIIEDALNQALKRNKAEVQNTFNEGFTSAAFGSLEKLTGMGNFAEISNNMKDLQSYKDQVTDLENAGITFGDVWDDANEKVIDSNDKLSASFDSLAVNIAGSLVSLVDNLDLFGTEFTLKMAKLALDNQTNQAILDDSFKRGNITYQEYAIQKKYMQRVAVAEEKRANVERIIDQKITIAQFLENQAKEFAALAIAYGFISIFDPVAWKKAAGYAAAAAALGVASAAYGSAGSYQAEKYKAEAEYNKEVGIAENEKTQAERLINGTTQTATGSSINGSISAQEIKITISPITTIKGETVIMSNIGVMEAGEILGENIVKRIQTALDNKEITVNTN
jgi:hypothetical protein